MKKELKTFFVIITVFGIFMWHHQATLFQRHVRETLQLLKDVAGPTVQLGDMTFSKYLFKVEFKKPQIDISLKSIEDIKLPNQVNNNPLVKTIIERLKSYTTNYGINYRLADKLTITYNPFWQELTLTSSGDGELSLYNGDEKVNLIVPDHSDVNQGKVKVSLPSSGWLYHIKRLFSKTGPKKLVRITSTCRNVKIIDANTQEPLYTQDFSSSYFSLGEDYHKEGSYYTLHVQSQIDNAFFSPNLAKIWQAFEPYVIGGNMTKSQDYKIRVHRDEFWSFINTLLPQLNSGLWDWKSLVKDIPTLYLEGKTHLHNQALTLKDDYMLDYQPTNNFFRTDINYNFEAGPAWPAYLEKTLNYYSTLTDSINSGSSHPSKEVLSAWGQSLLAKLVGKGEIKTAFMLELKDMNTEKFQAQSSFKLGVDNCSINIGADYLTPPLVKVTLDFEDYEKLLNKFYSYSFSVLEEMGNKTSEILLSGVKNYIGEEIEKLSIVKDEKNPLLRTIPVQFNTETQALEVANKPIHHEIIELIKMIVGFINQGGVGESLKKLNPYPVTE